MKRSYKSKPTDQPGLSMEELKARYLALKEPDVPMRGRYKTNDATAAKLHELLSSNPRGILVIRDELMGLLGRLSSEEHLEDRAFYLEGWNGNGTFTCDRIGRGTIVADCICLSVLGCITPDKLRGYLRGAMREGADDGMMPRFQLLVYADNDDWRYVDQIPDRDAKDKAYGTFRALSADDFTLYGAESPSDKSIPFLRFDAEAQEFFKAWLTDLEQNKLRCREEPIILEHLSKFRSLMPSLALIDHLIERLNGSTASAVPLASAQRAASWCDFLEAHARRIYGLVTNIGQKAAGGLAEKLKQRKLKSGFTCRDVYVNEWSCLNTPEAAQSAVNELVARKWLRERKDERSIRYDINPRIYS
jgi:hypothetical protein